MNFISKLPGPLLIFLGAFCLSFGGLIVKSFEGSTLWQILFWRQVFFIITVTIFLYFNYKNNIFSKIYLSGIPGLIGGIILGIGFSSYVLSAALLNPGLEYKMIKKGKCNEEHLTDYDWKCLDLFVELFDNINWIDYD